MVNADAVGGFQIAFSGATIAGVSGGLAQDAGFSVSTNTSKIIGISFTGASIAAGDGVITTVEFTDFDTEICFDAAIISDPVGGAIDFDLGPCEDGSGGDDCADGIVDDCGVCDLSLIHI